uniref:Uncharacterized protein n=1 Tax=Arundo donax TaxID=35708 RepID=A0A0A9AXV1_ARUDO
MVQFPCLLSYSDHQINWPLLPPSMGIAIVPQG